MCDVRREHALCTRVSGLLDGRHRCDEGWAQKRLHVRPRTRCSCRPAWSFLAAFGKRRRFPLPQAAGFLTPPGPRDTAGFLVQTWGRAPALSCDLPPRKGVRSLGLAIRVSRSLSEGPPRGEGRGCTFWSVKRWTRELLAFYFL